MLKEAKFTKKKRMGDNNYEDEMEVEKEEHENTEFDGRTEEVSDAGEVAIEVTHLVPDTREQIEKQIQFCKGVVHPTKKEKQKEVTIAQVLAPIGMEENTIEEEESSDNDFRAGDESSS